MTDDVGSVLPRSRAALGQARRVLDQLHELESSVEAYRDLVPYALDRLDNVWRTIETESRGLRTHEFGAWWSLQQTRTRGAVRQLRNAELKRGVLTTRKRSRFVVPGRLRIDEHGAVAWLREDGTEITSGPEALNVTAVEAESRWDFNVPGLADRPASQVLETVYAALAQQVLPTAERLLTAAG